MGLTRKQQNFLEFIQTYVENNGINPSLAEIAQHFGFKSLGTVQWYVNHLRANGYLQREPHAKREFKLLSPNNHLPLLGKVAAGQPLDYHFINKKIEVPSSMIREHAEHFVLEVSGDSMNDIGILDGDYVVIRKQNTAENKQIVVAMLNQEATIKHFIKKMTHIELHSENKKYQPIIVKPHDDFQIAGVFVGLLRMRMRA